VDAANVTANILRITGNVFVPGQVNVTGNVVAPFFFGNGLFLTGITANLSASQVMNILGNVSSPANVNASNVSANSILRVDGNAIIGGQVNVLGNIAANFFIGIGSALTGVQASVTASQVINVFGNVFAPGNVNASNVVANILRVNGNVVVGGQVNITGNIVANTFTGIGNLLNSITLSGTQNVNISGNVVSSGNVDASNISANSLVVLGNAIMGELNITGNITAPFYFGDGSRVTNIPACTAPTSICFVQPSSGFTSNTFCLDYAPTNGWSFVLPSNGAPSTIGIQTFSLPLDPSRPFSQLPANVTQTVSAPWAFSNGIWTSNVTLTSNGQFGPNTFNMGFSNFFGRYLGNSSNTAISSVTTPVNSMGLVSNVFANLSPVNIVASYVNPNTGDVSMLVAGTENSPFYPFMGRTFANNAVVYMRCNKNFTTVNGFNTIVTPNPGTTKGLTYRNQMSGYFVSETEMYFALQSDILTFSNNLRIYGTDIPLSICRKNQPKYRHAQLGSWFNDYRYQNSRIPDIHISGQD
jgi:cytoskeletal protein CcmA (bactofilin family)